MIANDTTHMTAALLYPRHEPLNFKHLATTLNLILEPAKLKFRVIHERPGKAAVLSCRKLHISIIANEASLASDDFQKTLGQLMEQGVSETLLNKIEMHTNTVEVSVGSGPLPHGPACDDPSATALLPLIAQMVANHLLNMNPADAIYWGETNKIMTPREFLAMINAPMAQAPEDQEPKGPGQMDAEPKTAPIPPTPTERPAPNTLRRTKITPREDLPENASTSLNHLRPSIIEAHLEEAGSESHFELSAHILERFSISRDGPKAAFVVSVATMLVAPIIGILLLIYNFMGGARLRQTAAFACMAAAVTLAAELVGKDSANATASVAPPVIENAQL